jgi:hypothetical protein
MWLVLSLSRYKIFDKALLSPTQIDMFRDAHAIIESVLLYIYIYIVI